MKRIIFLFCLILLTPAMARADHHETKRGTFAGIMRLEGRGLSNLLLFPVEWPHAVAYEAKHRKGWAAVSWIPAIATRSVSRAFSGMTDIVFLPLYYPFAKYDASIPVGMGFGEYPWNKSQPPIS